MFARGVVKLVRAAENEWPWANPAHSSHYAHSGGETLPLVGSISTIALKLRLIGKCRSCWHRLIGGKCIAHFKIQTQLVSVPGAVSRVFQLVCQHIAAAMTHSMLPDVMYLQYRNNQYRFSANPLFGLLHGTNPWVGAGGDIRIRIDKTT